MSLGDFDIDSGDVWCGGCLQCGSDFSTSLLIGVERFSFGVSFFEINQHRRGLRNLPSIHYLDDSGKTLGHVDGSNPCIVESPHGHLSAWLTD